MREHLRLPSGDRYLTNYTTPSHPQGGSVTGFSLAAGSLSHDVQSEAEMAMLELVGLASGVLLFSVMARCSALITTFYHHVERG